MAIPNRRTLSNRNRILSSPVVDDDDDDAVVLLSCCRIGLTNSQHKSCRELLEDKLASGTIFQCVVDTACEYPSNVVGTPNLVNSCANH